MPTSLLSPLSSPSNTTLNSSYVLYLSLYPLTLISLVIYIFHESCKYEISAKYEVDHIKTHQLSKDTLEYHPSLYRLFLFLYHLLSVSLSPFSPNPLIPSSTTSCVPTSTYDNHPARSRILSTWAKFPQSRQR